MAALNQPLADLAADLTAPAAGRRPGGLRTSQRRRLNVFRYVTFAIFALFFLLPLMAMVRFSFEGVTPGSWSVSAWTDIVSYPGPPPLLSSIEITLELAVITSGVMLLLVVPTMIWVQLRVQWFSRILEFICLLPLTIPAIVLVVGLAPIYNQIERYNVSALMLFWAYVILALPYAYRALAAGLAAVDARTLSEAARSLGARWPVVMFRIIVPNMWQAILNALLLTVALVLGEFTVAYLLSYVTLQPNLFEISRSSENAGVLFSASAATLAFAFILLMILSYAGRRLRRGRP
jgi:putative spermidine/putrescine transport system permease protein